MDERTITNRIKEFKWYMPVDFGNGIQARPQNSISPFHHGLRKWDYIVKRNLPNLQGKRVMDLGCNAGLFCIEMARMGAREVVGIDYDSTWSNWKDQALFVKEALEWRCQTTYNINYIDSDISKVTALNLGRFDVVIALCSLYYLKDKQIIELLKYIYSSSEYVLIQCNTRNKDHSLEVQRKSHHAYIGRILKEVGFPFVYYDKPWLYHRPIVVGSKYKIDEKPENVLFTDGARHWIRRKI